jgi:putative addiction module component (TIGR02574 family)
MQLVEELLNSFVPTVAAHLDDAWLVEIDRRSAEIDSGAVQTIAWDEVRRKARQRAAS